MPGVVDLWVPILLSAVAVFVVSFVLHMLIPVHKGEYNKLPDEDGIMSALRASGADRGEYMFPHAGSMKEAGTPEMLEKYNRGPVGMVTVHEAGPPNISRSLVLWFLYSILIGLFVAYLGCFALPKGSGYDVVFRFTGTVAILGYGVGYFLDSIWKWRPWKVTIKYVIDGVIYGLFTAGVFGWLWP